VSGESVGKPSQSPTRGRRRRPLRVPISDLHVAPPVDVELEVEVYDSLDASGNGAGSHANVVELDTQTASSIPVEVLPDRDPTEPMIMTEPDPLGGHAEALDETGDNSPPEAARLDEPLTEPLAVESEDLSDPGIDVHFSEPPLQPARTSPPASDSEPRYSEPPEELFLDDADVLSRSDIAPPPDQAAEMMIPIPKPPPPPQDSAESKAPDVEEDANGPWYEHFFGEAYLRTVRATTPKEVALECDFIERAARVPVGARVLDVGCGLGEQTVELAARGYHMVGLDISKTMVSRAYAEAEDRGLHIDFVRGDMREMSFEEPFDAVLCWGTTFGYFTEEENEETIRQFHQAIKPNGTLLIDVVNRDFLIASQPNQVWFEVDGAVCMEETDFDYQSSRLRVKRRVASHSGQQNDRHYSIRLYALHEIRALLERNGFRVDEVSGRQATLGIFFGVDSPKMIIRAERLPGPFAEQGNTPPPAPPSSVPKGALRPSDFPSDPNVG
jgi:SAM-dependent methyltransferase